MISISPSPKTRGIVLITHGLRNTTCYYYEQIIKPVSLNRLKIPNYNIAKIAPKDICTGYKSFIIQY